MPRSRLSRPARTQVAALAVAAAGIIVQIIGGVQYPAVPPGLVIILGAAALVVLVPWRWKPLIGVLGSGFLLVGGVAAARARYDLSHPGHPGAFAGTWIQFAALAVALVAGIVALAVRNRRSAPTMTHRPYESPDSRRP